MKFTLRINGTQLKVRYITELRHAETAVASLLAARVPCLGFDIETGKCIGFENDPQAGLCPYRSFPSLLQFYDGNGNVYMFDALHIPLQVIAPIFKHKRVVAHNAIFDLQHMLHAGISKLNIDCSLIMYSLVRCAEYASPEEEDNALDEEWEGGEGEGQLFDWLGKSERYGASLRTVCAKLLNLQVEKDHQTSNWTDRPLSREQLIYAAKDSWLTFEVGRILSRRIQRLGIQDIYLLNRKALHPIVHMILTGMEINTRAHEQHIVSWQRRKDELEVEVARIFGSAANVRSTHQIGKWLEKNLPVGLQHNGSWPRSVKTNKLRSDAKSLNKFSHLPFVKPLLEYKKLDKLLGTYGEPLLRRICPVTRRLHGSFTLGYTATGRLSSRNPNLQNLPRDSELRGIFKAPEGSKIIGADYGQIEIRVAAELSRDKMMLTAFKRGHDIHRLTAASITGKLPSNISKEERQLGKACFSADTELLTKTGWVRFDAYQFGTEIAQWSPPAGIIINRDVEHPLKGRYSQSIRQPEFTGLGGEIEFVSPLEFKSFDNRTTLHQVDREVDILATPDHELLWTDGYGGLFKTAFEDVPEGRLRHLLGAGFLRRTPSIPEDFLRVIVMAAADGSFAAVGKQIKFGFSKRRKYRRCTELLARLGVATTQRKNDQEVVTITASSEVLRDELLRWFTKDKALSWDLLFEADPYIFLEELVFWDGCLIENPLTNSCSFSTTVKQTAEVVQAIAVTSGIRASLRCTKQDNPDHKDLYTVYYNNACCPLIRPSWHPKSGAIQKVYCVQVPSGNIMIRRNNKVSIQANCGFGLLFGLGARGLIEYARWNYGVQLSEQEARDHIDKFFGTYSGYALWQKKRREEADKTFLTTTRVGKLRKLKEEGTYTRSVNHPVQGSAAEIVISALNHLHRELRCNNVVNMINCIHDEVLLQADEGHVDEAKEILQRCMEQAARDVFPKISLTKLVDVKVGSTWADTK